MSETAPIAPAPRHARTRRQPVLRWIVVGVVLLIVAVGLWIAIRGVLARDALTGAAPLVRHAQQAVLEGSPENAKADLAEVQRRTAEARALTSDPIWRVTELVPLVGPNLTAFREAAVVVDDVAAEALPPLAEAAAGLDFAAFVPKDGRLDIAPLVAARPLLQQGAEAMARAVQRADVIETEHTVPQIGEAVDQLIDLVEETNGLVTGVAGATEILPGMLGYEGSREYILLALNNAELRAAGGIPGALALIHADEGHLQLGEQTTASHFGRRDEPLPLEEWERNLYTDNLGLYMQNVTDTPWFARTADLTLQQWEERYGETPDGVLTVDPIALSYILTATGPIEVQDGIVLDADTAVETLLNGVYARYDDPDDQDEFFARAFQVVFDRLAGGDLNAQALVDALVRAGSERRLLVWSGHESEQAVIASGQISGHPPLSTDDRYGIGVYYHDVTESKMDWYLQTAITVASVECRNDDRPFYEVRVQIASTAPADVSSIPEYVTGSKYTAGEQRTAVFVYVPAGSQVYDARIDDESVPWTAESQGDYEVAMLQETLLPGEDAVLSFHVLGPPDAPLAVTLDHTPTAFDVPVSVDNVMACPSVRTETDQFAVPTGPAPLL